MKFDLSNLRGNIYGGLTAGVLAFAGVFASLPGDLRLIFASVVLAGLVQIAFGILNLGQYIRLVPLRTHPSVATRLARGDLTLHGWVYDIKTGDVHAHDEASQKFIPVEKRYAQAIAKLAGHGYCPA